MMRRSHKVLNVMLPMAVLLICLIAIGCDASKKDDVNQDADAQENTEDSTEEIVNPEYVDGVYSIMKGQVIKTDNDCYFLVSDGNHSLLKEGDFIQMLSAADDVDLTPLETGDCIRIWVVTVEETYPLVTNVYKIELLSHGDANNIPADVVSELNDLGYVLTSFDMEESK